MNKQYVVYTYTGVLLNQNEVLIDALTWMNFEDFMLNEMNHTKGQILYDSSHMRDLELLIL